MQSVFISSTCTDLTEYREVARKAAAKKDLTAILSEDWEAAGYPPYLECMERIDALDPKADVVVAIVARWYGWIPPDQPDGAAKSITRLECERAAARGLTIIPFFLPDDAVWPEERDEDHRLTLARQEKKKGKAVDLNAIDEEIERNKAALDDFEKWLATGRQFKEFRSPADLKGEVIAALDSWMSKRRPGVGGRASSAASSFDRAAYLRLLVESCEPVPLLGLDAKQAQSTKLRQVYVPALAGGEDRGDPEKLLRRQRPGAEDERAPLLLDRIGRGSLYVAGAPGSGKSTFCRWLALVAGLRRVPDHVLPTPEEYAERFPPSLRDRLPLLVPLRHFGRATVLDADGKDRLVCRGSGQWTADNFIDALCAWVEHGKPHGLDGTSLRALLAKGQCLLIFDGVDELPLSVDEGGRDHRPRASFLSGLADALRRWGADGNRVVLTSRPYGLQSDERGALALAATEIAPLPDSLQELFVHRWYHTVDRGDAERLTAALLRHLNERQDEGVVEMRQSPLLLTALCVKFHQGETLPKDVHELYDKVVDQVLYSHLGEGPGEQRIRRQLAAIALGMHTGDEVGARRKTLAARVTRAEVDRILERMAVDEHRAEGGADSATEKREILLSDSGLLLPRDDNEAEFYHLSFQEFLAAERIHSQADSRTAVIQEQLRARAGTAEWRRTLTFLFAVDASQRAEQTLRVYVDELTPKLAPKAVRANPNPAILLAECLEISHAKGWPVDDLADSFLTACKAALDVVVDPKARIRLWEVAGRLGFDRRPGVGLNAHGLPDIVWCDVPAGEVVLEGRGGKHPVAAFRIAKYPVTHAQFQAFVDAPDGYANPDWWDADAERHPVAQARWTAPNGPRESVDWWEATAFCRWLTTKRASMGDFGPGTVIRLPAEWEWQQSATGGRPDREFPWAGDWSEKHCNACEGGAGRTSVVGLYPTGDSPVGACDMAGNIWEWCANRFDSDDVWRVVRGGSWLGGRDAARAASRHWCRPAGRRGNLGFRVCVGSHRLDD